MEDLCACMTFAIVRERVEKRRMLLVGDRVGKVGVVDGEREDADCWKMSACVEREEGHKLLGLLVVSMTWSRCMLEMS